MRFLRPRRTPKPLVRPSVTPRIELLEDRATPATITVNTLNDTTLPGDKLVSLRDAIIAVNTGNLPADADVTAQSTGAFGTNDTILFDPTLFPAGGGGQVISLGSALPTITNPLTITGPGAGILNIDANFLSRVFDYNDASGNFGLSGIGIIHGVATIVPPSPGPGDDGSGGGIRIQAGGFVASGITLDGNVAASVGGGLAALVGTSVTVVDSRFMNNKASISGGGVYVAGPTPGGGGSTGSVRIERAYFFGNSSLGGDGGGVQITGAFTSSNLINLTFFNNTAIGSGGAAAVDTGDLTYITAVGNTADSGGGLHSSLGAVTILNSIIAQNTANQPGAPADVVGNLTSGNGNVFGDIDPAISLRPFDISGVTDAKLNPVGFNGGASETFSLQPGSPAIGRGQSTSIDKDQRNLPRPTTTGIDAGAFQAQAAVATNDPTGFNIPFNTTKNFPAPGVIGNDNAGDPAYTAVTAVPGSVTQPPAGQGTVTLNADGSFTYQPPSPAFSGTTTFTYTATNGIRASAPATVTLNIAAGGAPVANPDSYTALANTTLSIAANVGVLVNDQLPNPTNPGGTALKAVSFTQPVNGGTVNGQPDGSFVFTPTAGFTGTATFTYVATDGVVNSAPGTVTIAVNAANLPTANPDVYTPPAGSTTLTIPAATGLLANDKAPNPANPGGQPLTTTAVTQPTSGGTVTVQPDGSFTFNITPGFSGTTTFAYKATDGVAVSNPAVVTVNITAPTNAPTAAADTFTTPAGGGTLTIFAPGVLSNDKAGAGGPLVATISTPPDAKQGTATLNADGSFTFTPVAGFSGNATFQYIAVEGSAKSAPATVTVTVGVPPTGTALFAVGGGAGAGPRVRVFDESGRSVVDFMAFDPALRGGVRVATGDINGDGAPEVIAGNGPQGQPLVGIFDARTGSPIRQFLAFESSVSSGVFVSAADVTGDGKADVIVSTGSGGGARIQVFDGPTGAVVANFMAYDPNFRGGARIAAGDLNGDGKAEIVTVPGPSGSPHVKVFGISGGAATELKSFFGFDPSYRGGTFVAVSGGSISVSADSTPEFSGTFLDLLFPGLPNFNGSLANRPTVAADVVGDPVVFTLTFDQAIDGGRRSQVTAYPAPFQGGVRLGAGKSSTGTPLVYTATGAGGGSRVNIFSNSGGSLSPVLTGLNVFESTFQGSVYVG
jgi:hypothetical protein